MTQGENAEALAGKLDTPERKAVAKLRRCVDAQYSVAGEITWLAKRDLLF